MIVQKIRKTLASGGRITMVNPHHASSGLVQRLVESGADTVFLDCEHGPWTHDDVRISSVVAQAAGGGAIARPHSHERPVLIRYLNMGAHGLMVPMVNTAGQARAIVEAMRYAFPADPDGRLFVLMIESLEGIANLDEILQVEGVDVVFVGPTDLTQSMGYVPGPGPRPPEVIARIEDVFARVRAANKVPGMLVNTSDIAHWTGKGAQFLYIHSDPFLQDGLAHIKSLAVPAEPLA